MTKEFEEDVVEFDEIEATKYIIDKIHCTEEQCAKYFEAQFEYYETLGLVKSVEEHETDMKAIAEGKMSEADLPQVTLYLDKMAEYIAEHSNLPIELVNQIVDAENDYCDVIGLNQYFDEV